MCSCFHTTQYDLNFHTILLWRIFGIRFHTTQYDLNSSGEPEVSDICGFPYYIVRFKLARFVAKNPKIIEKSFHTTQYDLNQPSLLRSIAQTKKFPYYIVRFKLEYRQQAGGLKIRFHTTQYDLNQVNDARPRGLHAVSILHSTI